MKKLSILLTLVLVGFFAGKVYAHTNKAWSNPDPEKWSDCQPIKDITCGSTDGYQTQTVTCIEKDRGNDSCSLGTWVEPVYKCPVIDWHYGMHNVSVPYEKSSDPTKCHRPSDSDLHDVYGMGNSERYNFKSHHPETLNANIEETGYYDNPQTKVIQQSCRLAEPNYSACTPAGQCPEVCGQPASEVPDGKGGTTQCQATAECPDDSVYGCTDQQATNYNPEATKDDESCTYPQPTPEPKEEPKGKTFHKDTRCLDSTPDAPQWFVGEDGSALNNWHPLLTWSATGGDKVEIKFSEDPSDLRWQFTTENDGHEIIGYMENTGLLGMINYYYQMRVINGCKVGDWSPVVRVFN